MKIPFSKKEIVVQDRAEVNEEELTEEQKEELKLKNAKRGVFKTIALTAASFAAGMGAGIAGYKKYKEENKSEKYGSIDIHTDDINVASAAFDAIAKNDDEESEE